MTSFSCLTEAHGTHIEPVHLLVGTSKQTGVTPQAKVSQESRVDLAQAKASVGYEVLEAQLLTLCLTG